MAGSKAQSNIRVSPLLSEAARTSHDAVFQSLNTSANGLTQHEAEERSAKHGPNDVAQEKRHGGGFAAGLAPAALLSPPRHQVAKQGVRF